MIQSIPYLNTARLTKMKDFLRQEHEDILKKIREQSEYIYNMSMMVITIEKGKNSNYEEIQRTYALFQRACEGILETYFPLLCDDDFLALQT